MLRAVAAGRAHQLGDARSDIVNALAVIMGQTKAEKFFADFEKLVEQRAKAGAEAAIPGIRVQVREEARKTIKPWMIGAFGGVAVASGLGLVALARSRKRRRN
jgi:hypothetical protein